MLSLKHRLKKDRDFEKVFKKGRAHKNPFFSIKFHPNRVGSVRVGIVVGRKVSPKSTERNKLKRRIRESLKTFLPKIKRNIDIVIVSFSRSRDLDFRQIKEDIEDLLKKARLL